MERLHSGKDLATFLRKQRDRRITIVSAFASGTTELLKAVDAANHVELVLGTINAFTSPSFIDAAKALIKQRLWVDFRGATSVHWKLYLISPKTVVIGSANFTNLGVGLARDTCVVITNAALYDDYMQEVGLLKKSEGVMTPGASGFDAALEHHRDQHNRNQAALQRAREASQPTHKARSQKTSFDDWAEQGFVTIPFFVWGRNHTRQETDEVSRLMGAMEDGANDLVGSGKKPNLRPRKLFRDFLAPEIDGPKAPFEAGDIVLTTNTRGAYMRFMQLDVIVESAEQDRYLMIERRKARYPEPFYVTPAIKAAVLRLMEQDRVEDYAIPVEALQSELLSG